jgi:hypothetical protein
MRCNQLSASRWQFVHLTCHSPRTVPQLEHDQIILGIDVFDRVVGNPSFRDDFDFLQLGSIEAKESRHFDNLTWADEVRRILAEFFNSRMKLATSHRLGHVQA